MIDRPRILIIDEDRRTVDELQERFTRSGFEAEVALSGTVGLSIVEERRMTAAVLSARLGHMEDWALVRRLREHDPRLPLVLFNAPKVKGMSREGRRAGVTKFISDPAEPDQVMAETLKALNG